MPNMDILGRDFSGLDLDEIKAIQAKRAGWCPEYLFLEETALDSEDELERIEGHPGEIRIAGQGVYSFLNGEWKYLESVEEAKHSRVIRYNAAVINHRKQQTKKRRAKRREC